MTKSENTLIYFIMALSAGLVLILALIIINRDLNREPETIKVTEIRKEYVYEKFLSRKEVNEYIQKEEKIFYFLGFYRDLTGNREVAEAILNNALEKEVPVNLAFSLAFMESSFNPDAVNESNRNNTIDRGLFQLNSGTFSNNTDWFDPEESSRLGLDYLRTKKKQYTSWESAIVLYNAGVESNLSNRSLRYLSRILQKERHLDERFNSFRRNINHRRNED